MYSRKRKDFRSQSLTENKNSRWWEKQRQDPVLKSTSREWLRLSLLSWRFCDVLLKSVLPDVAWMSGSFGQILGQETQQYYGGKRGVNQSGMIRSSFTLKLEEKNDLFAKNEGGIPSSPSSLQSSSFFSLCAEKRKDLSLIPFLPSSHHQVSFYDSRGIRKIIKGKRNP